MTRIAIVGGGRAGMPLALGLLDKGYDVTVATNRKPDEVRAGSHVQPVHLRPGAADRARPGHRRMGRCLSACQGIGFAVPHPEQAGAKAIDWPRRWTARPRPWTSA